MKQWKVKNVSGSSEIERYLSLLELEEWKIVNIFYMEVNNYGMPEVLVIASKD